MPRVFLMIIVLLFLNESMMAQQEVDSLQLSSFRKGRNLVGISGSVSSSNMDLSQIFNNPSQLGNVYNFDVKLGKFVANKNLLGITFNASRTHLIGYAEVKTEVLSVGPWYRIYLGKKTDIAFYLQSTLHYSSYFGTSSGVQIIVPIDEEIEAKGINGSLGLGICYIIADRISFEVGCDFRQGRFWGKITDNTLKSSHDIVLDRDKFVFSFGFAVLFGKFKGDD